MQGYALGRAKCRGRIHNENYTSEGGRVKLDSGSLEKDLGVNVDNELKFRKHVNIEVEKANRLLAIIRRNFIFIDAV